MGQAPSMSGTYLLWTENTRAAKPIAGAKFRSTLKVYGEASPLLGLSLEGSGLGNVCPRHPGLE